MGSGDRRRRDSPLVSCSGADWMRKASGSPFCWRFYGVTGSAVVEEWDGWAEVDD